MTLTTTDAEGQVRMRWQTLAAIIVAIGGAAFTASQVYGRIVTVESAVSDVRREVSSLRTDLISRMDKSDAKTDRFMAAFGLNGSSVSSGPRRTMDIPAPMTVP